MLMHTALPLKTNRCFVMLRCTAQRFILLNAIMCPCNTTAGDNVSKVLVFKTDGEFLCNWNTPTLEMPHGIFLANAASSDPTVWITDVGNGPYGHCIKQYSPSGKLLQVNFLIFPF